jgi:hypothetical protein
VTNVARLLRGLPPILAVAVAATAIALPAAAAVSPASSQAVTRASQWWLTALRAPAALRAAPEAGKGITVAVLSTGVDAKHPDLAGAVTEGPDFSKTGRTPGGSYWGAEGTAVASLIAGRGHGSGGGEGVTGIAPGARILSLQVTLEYNDPLNSDAAITRRLPAAIAAGIRYAVGHGATVIALPLDPGTLEAAPSGDPAAGGSAAERAAVNFALARNVLLVAPAGDNGAGAVNYPAAYPGVIAVGATARDGELAPFTSTHSYTALTAPGSGTTPDLAASSGMTVNPAAGLMVAAPDGGYEPLASSDMSAALTAGVAALIRSRYPWLTVAEVTQAVEHGVTPPPGGTAQSGAAGQGRGELDAEAALDSAAATAAAHPAPAPAPSAPPTTAPAVQPATGPVHQAAPSPSDPGHLLRSLVVGLAVAAGVLIACLVAAITLTRLRRRARANKSAGLATVGRAGHVAARARHARGQPATRTTPVPARVVIWPSTPALPAAGISDSPPVPSTRGKPASRAYRRPRPVGNPPWQPATPPRSPGALPEMLPAQPALEAAGPPLAPWEESPADFATAPTADDLAPWPISNTGPMYVWNPAATGPIAAVGGDDEEAD